MKRINKLAVFCGASAGNLPEYTKNANELAELLVSLQIAMVYGGANVGLMGVLANRMLTLGGTVIGVIPESLKAKELAHEGLTELHVVSSMHERKSLMAKLADGYLLLPGGVGSLDEFFEVFTWMHLGMHQKPCGIFNIENYFDTLIQFLEGAVRNGFMKKIYLDSIIVEKKSHLLMERFNQYQHSVGSRWEPSAVPAETG